MITQIRGISIPKSLNFTSTGIFESDFKLLVSLIDQVPKGNRFLQAFVADIQPMIQSIEEKSVTERWFESTDDQTFLFIQLPENHPLNISDNEIETLEEMGITLDLQGHKAEILELLETFEQLADELNSGAIDSEQLDEIIDVKIFEIINKYARELDQSPSPLKMLIEDLEIELAGKKIERTGSDYLSAMALTGTEPDGLPLMKRFLPNLALSDIDEITKVFGLISKRARQGGDSETINILCRVLNIQYARENMVCHAMEDMTISLIRTPYWEILSEEVREAVLSKQ